MVARKDNPTVAENRRAGTTEWQLTSWQVDADEGLRSPAVEGYASRTRVASGESIDLCVSTYIATSVLIEIYRPDYYDGLGGRLMGTLGPFHCQPQLVPYPGEGHLRACTWPATYRLDVPAEWVGGVYLARLTIKSARGSPTGPQSYIIFIKDRLAKVVLLVLIVEFLQHTLGAHYTVALDLLYLAIGIALIGAALYLSGRH